MTGFPMQTMPQGPNNDNDQQAADDAALMERHADLTDQLKQVVSQPEAAHGGAGSLGQTRHQDQGGRQPRQTHGQGEPDEIIQQAGRQGQEVLT